MSGVLLLATQVMVNAAAALLIEVEIGYRHRIVELDGQVLAVTHSIVVNADALT